MHSNQLCKLAIPQGMHPYPETWQPIVDAIKETAEHIARQCGDKLTFVQIVAGVTPQDQILVEFTISDVSAADYPGRVGNVDALFATAIVNARQANPKCEDTKVLVRVIEDPAWQVLV